MTMSQEMSMPREGGLIGRYRSLLRMADRLPLSLVQLAGRIAVAHVFWQSAQTKIASWPVTLQLFALEYNLPLIDPAIAAPLATLAEITGAVLLFLGLFSRVGALMLLGVVAVIQIFVFPGHWAEHLMWSSVLLLVLARGAGALSLDHLAASYFHRGA
ncbi:DoxX family protein [Mesorhizobium sp. L-8-3]|uniref:DoxX family protein n=1 Tax=Mesorhizobium sp. L-8-3 TaxID=2744522 RepID=UPI001927E1E9|nr:DoxX family protein [Mesorhizobium sp. L-8-3]